VIHRRRHLAELERRLKQSPVVVILGARQVGKTTLAGELAKRQRSQVHGYDLEDVRDEARLEEPMLTLPDLRGLVVIDEVQRRPELFPAIRVLADRKPCRTRFLLLGSASPDLLRQSSESLAGRVSYYDLPGFSVDELGTTELRRLWLRGGFPRSFLASSNADSLQWRQDFIKTFLERDIPRLGFSLRGGNLQRFWYMLANGHGQVANLSNFAASLGVSQPTIRNYLDILVGTFVVTILPPWHENIRKRQVKSPKLYVTDSGLLHTLLDVKDLRELERHPLLGASWEGFALHEVVRHLGAQPSQCYFWATHQGAELDLLVVAGRRRLGFEFKRTAAPKKTKSMAIAMQELRLDSLDVVHAGRDTYPLDRTCRALALSSLVDVPPLR